MAATEPHLHVVVHLHCNDRPQPPAAADLCPSWVAMDMEVEVPSMVSTDPRLPVVFHLCRNSCPQPLAVADLYASTVPPQRTATAPIRCAIHGDDSVLQVSMRRRRRPPSPIPDLLLTVAAPTPAVRLACAPRSWPMPLLPPPHHRHLLHATALVHCTPPPRRRRHDITNPPTWVPMDLEVVLGDGLIALVLVTT